MQYMQTSEGSYEHFNKELRKIKQEMINMKVNCKLANLLTTNWIV